MVPASAGMAQEPRVNPGMTGGRLVLALIECDDPAVQAVLATATDLDGLRARIEAEITSTVA